ncbi:hypothetical protein HG535_0A02620 [Zygotorulaspora mrakii]|uniref:ORC6 first cyclin-like domain-containing protein n=1 Tax=Zygotorulaspora mrakii TaxID=42260 RepID=A0A7H9AW61_ZYGMR|nr:uncharacterized protein HG535_0A02620 [Zygotorulaspora mrakii]QLG70324.1 hypothetical protein HG535_0A02620 [Zygotorulaspora mrakii]
MSSQQVQRCIRDVLGINDDDPVDWTESHMKKLASATSVLYNSSMAKVMLKKAEETARCHLCAYMAAQRLQKKHDPDLQYYLDRIPLEPTKSRKLVELFEQNLLQTSPMKNFTWTPSPKKRKMQSPIKGNVRFTSLNPSELRQQLFDTPTREKNERPIPEPPVEISPEKTSPSKARRKLAFEEEFTEEEVLPSTPMEGIAINERISELSMQDEEYLSNDSPSKRKKSAQSSEQTLKRRKDGKGRQEISLLHKKYYKVTPVEVINTCNSFELPKDVAYNILDQYMNYASNLVYPWQLVCGLVLNATFVVFTKRRRKDPRVDHLILSKMCGLMKCSQLGDIVESINLVKELIEGEKWYRDLQIKHDHYNGASYSEAISAKLGSMLQPNNILVSDEQFNNWRRNIEQDLSLRNIS